MSREQWGRVLGIVLTAVIALLAVFGYDVGVIQQRQAVLLAPEFGPAAERGLYATLCYRPEGGASFDCDSGGAFNVNTGAALAVDSGATATFAGTTTFSAAPTFSAGLNSAAAVTLTGLNKIAAGGSITVTNGAAFTPTATFQPIAAAGAVTPTLTIPAAGVALCVYNTSSNAVLIQDTGNQVLTADATLGQYDVLCGYSDGTRFIETSRANN